jgi:hypothetical protein
VRSGTALGVKLVQHNLEPPDDGRGPVHVLRYHPTAIVVRPVGGGADALADLLSGGGAAQETVERSLGGAFNETVPVGCVALTPRKVTTRNITFPSGNPLIVNGVELTTFSVRRTGFGLALGYCYTFHFCQGASFNKGEPWLLHLTPPPDRNGLDGQGILVATTRFQAGGDLYMLEPLYEPAIAGDEDRVVAIFEEALRRSPDLEAEDRRLEDLDKATRLLHLGRLAALHGVQGAPAVPEPTVMAMPSVQQITSELAEYERELGRFAWMEF